MNKCIYTQMYLRSVRNLSLQSVRKAESQSWLLLPLWMALQSWTVMTVSLAEKFLCDYERRATGCNRPWIIEMCKTTYLTNRAHLRQIPLSHSQRLDSINNICLKIWAALFKVIIFCFWIIFFRNAHCFCFTNVTLLIFTICLEIHPPPVTFHVPNAEDLYFLYKMWEVQQMFWLIVRAWLCG